MTNEGTAPAPTTRSYYALLDAYNKLVEHGTRTIDLLNRMQQTESGRETLVRDWMGTVAEGSVPMGRPSDSRHWATSAAPKHLCEEVGRLILGSARHMSGEAAKALFLVFCTGIQHVARERVTNTENPLPAMIEGITLALHILKNQLLEANRRHGIFFHVAEVEALEEERISVAIYEQTLDGLGMLLGRLTNDGTWEPSPGRAEDLIRSGAPTVKPADPHGRVYRTYVVEGTLPFTILWPMRSGGSMQVRSNGRTP